VADAYDAPIYLVGSVLTTSGFRDIDLRLILPDDEVARLFPTPALRLLVHVALSDLITASASPPAPLDFQVQSMTEAAQYQGGRNPIGLRVDRAAALWPAMTTGVDRGQ
jgi:hypothetical protein